LQTLRFASQQRHQQIWLQINKSSHTLTCIGIISATKFCPYTWGAKEDWKTHRSNVSQMLLPHKIANSPNLLFLFSPSTSVRFVMGRCGYIIISIKVVSGPFGYIMLTFIILYIFGILLNFFHQMPAIPKDSNVSAITYNTIVWEIHHPQFILCCLTCSESLNSLYSTFLL
jgi:hypothetical protein